MSVHSKMTALAKAIRSKSGRTDPLTIDGMISAVNSITVGGIELPSLSNCGTASDLAEGKNLYDDAGNLIEGTVKTMAEGDIYSTILDEALFIGSSGNIRVSSILTEDILLRKGAISRTFIPATKFGNAQASQVLAGATFTSESGLFLTGQYIPPTPNLQDKTITENGTYTPDDGYDGFGKVLVDVMAGSGGDGSSDDNPNFATGTITPASDISLTGLYEVEHGLGKVPDFYVIFPKDGYSAEMSGYLTLAANVRVPDTLVGAGNIGTVYKETSSNATSYATLGMIPAAVDILFNSTTFAILANGQSLKAGVTYVWACGVLESLV